VPKQTLGADQDARPEERDADRRDQPRARRAPQGLKDPDPQAAARQAIVNRRLPISPKPMSRIRS